MAFVCRFFLRADKPYMQPNNKLSYVHQQSKHPPTRLISLNINKRLTNISFLYVWPMPTPKFCFFGSMHVTFLPSFLDQFVRRSSPFRSYRRSWLSCLVCWSITSVQHSSQFWSSGSRLAPSLYCADLFVSLALHRVYTQAWGPPPFFWENGFHYPRV